MTNETEAAAIKVVAAFKQNLGVELEKQIGRAQFDDLAIMIREALSAQLAETTKMVEDLVRELRAKTDRPQLGM